MCLFIYYLLIHVFIVFYLYYNICLACKVRYLYIYMITTNLCLCVNTIQYDTYLKRQAFVEPHCTYCPVARMSLKDRWLHGNADNSQWMPCQAWWRALYLADPHHVPHLVAAQPVPSKRATGWSWSNWKMWPECATRLGRSAASRMSRMFGS